MNTAISLAHEEYDSDLDAEGEPEDFTFDPACGYISLAAPKRDAVSDSDSPLSTSYSISEDNSDNDTSPAIETKHSEAVAIQTAGTIQTPEDSDEDIPLMLLAKRMHPKAAMRGAGATAKPKPALLQARLTRSQTQLSRAADKYSSEDVDGMDINDDDVVSSARKRPTKSPAPQNTKVLRPRKGKIQSKKGESVRQTKPRQQQRKKRGQSSVKPAVVRERKVFFKVPAMADLWQQLETRSEDCGSKAGKHVLRGPLMSEANAPLEQKTLETRFFGKIKGPLSHS